MKLLAIEFFGNSRRRIAVDCVRDYKTALFARFHAVFLFFVYQFVMLITGIYAGFDCRFISVNPPLPAPIHPSNEQALISF
jgi:hypothetical protein